ncbi:MAG: hypothetical protein XD54_0493 [Thermococcus sibiricus]|uniref:Uncharacterized protein n=1 Tax=Thermococcus sibiricus TaxID=172049 RepID=A0A101EMX5_9EURY|nr:MAG: hypothetical protein XD54_0493 [Thermococcus sibiricus]
MREILIETKEYSLYNTGSGIKYTEVYSKDFKLELPVIINDNLDNVFTPKKHRL